MSRKKYLRWKTDFLNILTCIIEPDAELKLVFISEQLGYDFLNDDVVDDVDVESIDEQPARADLINISFLLRLLWIWLLLVLLELLFVSNFVDKLCGLPLLLLVGLALATVWLLLGVVGLLLAVVAVVAGNDDVDDDDDDDDDESDGELPLLFGLERSIFLEAGQDKTVTHHYFCTFHWVAINSKSEHNFFSLDEKK